MKYMYGQIAKFSRVPGHRSNFSRFIDSRTKIFIYLVCVVSDD